jgi:hypothetical protein
MKGSLSGHPPLIEVSLGWRLTSGQRRTTVAHSRKTDALDPTQFLPIPRVQITMHAIHSRETLAAALTRHSDGDRAVHRQSSVCIHIDLYIHNTSHHKIGDRKALWQCTSHFGAQIQSTMSPPPSLTSHWQYRPCSPHGSSQT